MSHCEPVTWDLEIDELSLPAGHWYIVTEEGKLESDQACIKQVTPLLDSIPRSAVSLRFASSHVFAALWFIVSLRLLRCLPSNLYGAGGCMHVVPI